MNQRINITCYLQEMKTEYRQEKWFKVEFIFSIFSVAFQTFIYYGLFSGGFIGSTTINPVKITEYYIVVNILYLSNLPAQFVAYKHMDDINSGKIIIYLLRPSNYIISSYVKTLVNFIVRFAVNVLVICITLICFTKSIDIVTVVVGSFSTLLGFSILYLIQAIIGCFAIWFHDISRFRDVIMSLLMVLGGRLVPGEYLFAQIKKIVYFTPIPYIYDIPVNVFMGNVDVYRIIIQIIWVLLFGGSYFFLFSKFVKNNIEYGG